MPSMRGDYLLNMNSHISLESSLFGRFMVIEIAQGGCRLLYHALLNEPVVAILKVPNY